MYICICTIDMTSHWIWTILTCHACTWWIWTILTRHPYAHVYLYLHVYVHVYAHVCVHVGVNVHAHVCVGVYVCFYVDVRAKCIPTCVNRPFHLFFVVCQNLIVNPCKIIKEFSWDVWEGISWWRHQMVEWFMSSLLVHARWSISMCLLASMIRDAMYADGGVIWLGLYAHDLVYMQMAQV